MKNSIIFKFLALLVVVILFVIGISFFSLRDVAIKSSIQSAESISKLVKNGLTNHMINNKTDELDSFFDTITNMPNVKDIWIVRSKYINEQFNKNKKNPKDQIDKDVLKYGKTIYKMKENISGSFIRVTIPYKANPTNGISCVQCHNVNEDTTLGAISIVLDLTTIKQIGLKSLYTIFSITFLAIILIYLFVSKAFEPYLNLYKKIKDNITKAKLGKFKNIVVPKELPNDIKEISDEYNNLINIFNITSNDIDEKLQGFVGYKSKNTNPLEQSKDIIDNLSNLYQFKKQVELDKTKDEIYNRLSEVFQNKFNLKNFTFLEMNTRKQKVTKVISVGESLYCNEFIKNNPDECRAARTKNDIISIDFHNSCPCFNKEGKFYYCFNVDITKNFYLIAHFVFDTKDELEELKNRSAFIKRYLKEASPSIEVKLLMNALQESAFTDGLTELYNRKFLDENLKKLIPQVNRDKKNIGLLMLDMDHFKAVNDEYGHDIGDKVLKELSRILQENVRESDVLVRYGGEEFIVLLVGVNSTEDALYVAHKIGQKVRENEIDIYAGTTIKKTVSIGLSMYPEDSNSFDNVIKNADIALYEAKSSGRDKVVRFNKEQVSSVDLF